LSRLHTAFVLGYHGCDSGIAEQIFSGKSKLKTSGNDYDWLGHGTYFWESDPERALEWAKNPSGKTKIKNPAVVGAIINLGNCLDLCAQGGVQLIASVYESYKAMRIQSEKPLPENSNPNGTTGSDRLIRRLDNAVIEHLHKVMKDSSKPQFDTVRGMFVEGDDIYPGAGFKSRNHVQIAVTNPDNILGYFRPLP
jgi:hypothetical protein